MYQCTRFDVSQVKGSQDIERSVFSYVQFFTLDLWISTAKWPSALHDLPMCKVWSLSIKGFSRYWVVSLFICPVWSLTSKCMGLIYYLGCTSVLSLKSVRQRILKIWNGQNTSSSSVNRPWSLTWPQNQ
jgi:hypothetical protein